ncbi:2205_t:CDS:1, partial [Gigaspora rosea]
KNHSRQPIHLLELSDKFIDEIDLNSNMSNKETEASYSKSQG